MKILIIHGPNLNMLGKREPEVYGNAKLADINRQLKKEARKLKAEVDFFQSNSEGDIVSKIQHALNNFDGIIINPGAYTHTSIAIRDSILSVGLPVIEVHISNIYKREDFRQKSFISGVSVGIISGLGINSYILGLRGMSDYLRSKKG